MATIDAMPTTRAERRQASTPAGDLPPARERTIIAAVMLCLLVYHGLTISRQCLFTDEIREIAITQWPTIDLLFANDSMPPLFPLLHRAWLQVWGTDAAARWFSALCGMLSVIAVWQFTRLLVDRVTGVTAAALFAVMPLPLYYAQLVRGYALMGLLAVLAIGTFALAERGRRSAYFAFVGVSVVGMYEHYYFAILLLSLALVWLVSRPRLPKSRGLAAFVAIALLSAPVIFFLKTDFGFQKELRAPRPMSVAALGYTFTSFFSGYSLGPSKADLHTLSTVEAAVMIAPWALAITGCVAPLAVAGFRRLREVRLAGPLVAMIVLPVLITGGLGALAGITYNVRFVAWCAAPLAVLLGAGACAPGLSPLRRAATLGLVAVMVVALANRNLNPRYFNEEYRSVAAYLDEHAHAQAAIFCVSGYAAGGVRYYLPGHQQRVLELPTPGQSSEVVTTVGQVDQAVAVVRSTPASQAWLLYCRPFHGDPEGKLLAALRAEFALEEAARAAGIVLFRATAFASKEPPPEDATVSRTDR